MKKYSTYYLLLMLAIVGLCCSCCHSCKEDEKGLLYGVVYTIDTDSTPYTLQGAVVEVYLEEGDKVLTATSTDAEGSYAILLNSFGRYEVQATYTYGGVDYTSERTKVYFHQDGQEMLINIYIE